MNKYRYRYNYYGGMSLMEIYFGDGTGFNEINFQKGSKILGKQPNQFGVKD